MLAAMLAVKAFAGAVFKWITENPVLFMLGVVLVVTNYLTYSWTKDHTAKEHMVTINAQAKTIEDYNTKIRERDAKITRLESESTTAALEVKKLIAAKAEETQKIVDTYEKRLEKANLKKYSITVPVDSTKKITETTVKQLEVMVEDGEVVCRRFPSVFLTTVNEMIDSLNDPVIKPIDSPSTTTPTTTQ